MSGTALLVAVAVHLGFQLCVTTLVYPALGQGSAQTFADRHQGHSRRITPVVILVYGGLLIACAWSLMECVDAASTAVGVTVVMLLAITGLGAAPRHGRLGRGWSRSTWTALMRLDRARLLLAVVLVSLAVWGS